MKRFGEFCVKVKIVAVELAALSMFLGLLLFVMYKEWAQLFLLLRH